MFPDTASARTAPAIPAVRQHGRHQTRRAAGRHRRSIKGIGFYTAQPRPAILDDEKGKISARCQRRRTHCSGERRRVHALRDADPHARAADRQ